MGLLLLLDFDGEERMVVAVADGKEEAEGGRCSDVLGDMDGEGEEEPGEEEEEKLILVGLVRMS